MTRTIVTVVLAILIAGALGGVIGSRLDAAIRSSKIASVVDSSDPTKVQPSDINPLTQPGTPLDGDVWIDRSGTSPSRTITMYIYDGGAWRILAGPAVY